MVYFVFIDENEKLIAVKYERYIPRTFDESIFEKNGHRLVNRKGEIECDAHVITEENCISEEQAVEKYLAQIVRNSDRYTTKALALIDKYAKTTNNESWSCSSNAKRNGKRSKK